MITDLEDYHFDNYECTFNTKNKSIFGSNIHSYDQEYYVEVFLNPNIVDGKDIFLLVDEVNLQDSTLYELANLVDENRSFSLEACPPATKVKICPEELRKLFAFYNNIASVDKGSGLATRIALDSSSNFCLSGGGRNSYRESSDQYALTARYDTTKQITHLNIRDGE